MVARMIFTSSHPHILTSSHPHIFTSSHLRIFSSSHHILTSSHLHIVSSSHLHIFSSSHRLSFTSSHPHILTSSHPHIFTFPLALLPSSFSFFSISLFRRGAVPRRRHETQPFRTKRGSINSFARNEVRSPKAEVKLRFWVCRDNPFARNEVRSPKAAVKLRFWVCRDNLRQPFGMKWGSIAESWSKIAIFECAATTLLREMRFDRQKLK